MESKELVSKSPAELISAAVSKDTDLDKLEKLLVLQERWEATEAKKAYHVAMAAFKAAPPKIEKDKTVAYGNTKYNHATLANVADKINSALSQHGLSASWTTKQNGAILVTCKITHIQGHSEETTLAAAADTSGSKNAIQAIGSAVSYLQRYTLLSLTGLATSEIDDDGKAATGAAQKAITEEEMAVLQDWIIKAGRTEADVLKYLKIESLDQMVKKDYNKAISALKARVAQNESK